MVDTTDLFCVEEFGNDNYRESGGSRDKHWKSLMNEGHTVLSQLACVATVAGFNLVGSGNVARFDETSPPEYSLSGATTLSNARSMVVIGSGGREFWRTFTETPTTADPDELRRAGGSIDAYSKIVLTRMAKIVESEGARCEILYPFGKPTRPVSFRRLAEHCGLGVADTVLGVVIHPKFGPWVSLRGTLVTDLELPETQRFDEFKPCNDCAQPCKEVCPIGTYDSETWDFASCVRYRLFRDGCPTGCGSRIACVIGRDERYSREEYQYRHEFTDAAKESLSRRYNQ